ncbi:MAG: hypothetical protein ACO1O1_00265 [Adhaeribacter sp.]
MEGSKRGNYPGAGLAAESNKSNIFISMAGNCPHFPLVFRRQIRVSGKLKTKNGRHFLSALMFCPEGFWALRWTESCSPGLAKAGVFKGFFRLKVVFTGAVPAKIRAGWP